MSDAGEQSSPSGASVSPSGTYRTRPSIAQYVESSVSGIFTSPSEIKIKLDVQSEHQVYTDDAGMLRGVFVVMATPVRLGAQLNLNVELPWGELMQLPGVIEWKRDVPRVSLRHRPGVGVKFELLPVQYELLERAMLLREPVPVPADAVRLC